ncbi:hypothetical protein [Saccharothrix variisporea]|uniref:Uncharacterized protein n=1 Tax=Saccharothrix variisporea TaxID=543527 RepID=A0A495XCQ9_9PSEU|nr:hypothetical protein [Saccharothrix variisporea]RKT72060.1 hypothetical protein DFJ66_5365 [Saccharothrix variisporea]
MGAVQLPHDIRGVRMCEHVAPGRCTWWCSYRRGVLCSAPVVGLLVLAGLVRWLAAAGEEDRDQVIYAFTGVSVFLAIVIPVVVFLNHTRPEKA